MSIVHTSLSVVLAKFPDHAEKIRRLFRQNSTFQAECEDYRQCFRALEHWSQSETHSAPSRREEYETLLKDLEEEILQTLKESI